MAPEMIAQSVSLGGTRESDRVMLLAVELFPLSSLLENVRQSSVLLEFGITTRISRKCPIYYVMIFKPKCSKYEIQSCRIDEWSHTHMQSVSMVAMSSPDALA